MSKRILSLVLILSILIIGFSVQVSAYQPYIIGMQNISDRIMNGKTNMYFVGDSITAVSATPRIPYGWIREANLNWTGGMGTSFTGIDDQGFLVTNQQANPPWNSTNIIPGEVFYWQTSSGYNTQQALYGNFTGDLAGGSTLGGFKMKPVSWADSSWFNNSLFFAKFFYEGSNGASGMPRADFFPIMVNGSIDFAGGVTLALNNSPIGVYNTSNIVIQPSRGMADFGMFVNTATDNESGRLYKPIGLSIRKNQTNGFWFGYIGDGGFTSRSHRQEGEVLNLAGEIVNTSYRDQALGAMIAGNDANTFLIWIGQNSAFDEWDGSTTRNYTRNVLNVINRYTDVYYSVKPGGDRPYFILVSTYDTGAANTKWLQEEEALMNITYMQKSYPDLVANATIGMVRLRAKINDTNGSYTYWNNSYTLPGDGIHPNITGARVFSRYIFDEIVLAIRPVNGTYDSISFRTQSYSMTNNSVRFETCSVEPCGVDYLSFNNTDLYPQRLNLSGIQNMLLYQLGGNALCTNIANCDNINATVANQTLVYGMNNYNISEGENRSVSPVWFSSANFTTKHVASNLTNTVNLTVSFGVQSCAITNITYTSNSSTFIISYAANEYNCSSLVVTIPSVPIEPAANSNEFLIDATDATPAATSCSTFHEAINNVLLGSMALLILVITVVSLYTFRDKLTPQTFVLTFIIGTLGSVLIVAVSGIIITTCG